MCVCACGSGVEGWVFSLAAFRYTGTAMESAVELLPSKDNHGKREERVRNRNLKRIEGNGRALYLPSYLGD